MAREPSRPTNRVINVITGGLVVGGESSAFKKAYIHSVCNISLETKRAKTDKLIVFLDDD